MLRARAWNDIFEEFEHRFIELVDSFRATKMLTCEHRRTRIVEIIFVAFIHPHCLVDEVLQQRLVGRPV